MYELASSPTQIFQDHLTGSGNITYTNDSSCVLLITGVVFCLDGGAGDIAQFGINDATIYTLTQTTDGQAVNAAINAQIIMATGDVIKFTSDSAAGSLGWVVSGYAINTNG